MKYSTWAAAPEGVIEIEYILSKVKSEVERLPVVWFVDSINELPEDIKNSKVLTGNDLAQLAGVEALPNETDVNEYKLIELSEIFVSLEDNPAELEVALHKRA